MNTQAKIMNDLATLTDAELVRRYVEEADMQALYILVRQRYCRKLKAVLGKYYPGGYDDYDLEVWLNDFYYDLTLPRKRDGGNRLDGYDAGMSFEAYISAALRNWAVDRAGREAGERERNRPLPTYADEVMGDDDAPCGTLAADDDTPEEERSASLVLALELLQSYPPEKRYIVLTYLLCDCYGESGRQLRLPARLAEQLGMEEAGVRQEKSRTFRKLRENAKKYLEKGVTFPSDDV